MNFVKEIVIGQVPDDFSEVRHIPIAPFCFFQKEDLFPGWESLFFEQDPLNTKEKFVLADNETCLFTKKKIEELAPLFNKNLRLNFSMRFWETMLNPWLLTLIQATWERQLRVESIIAKYKDENIKVKLLKDNINWEFVDTQDFIWALLSPLYNEWLISKIIEKNIPPAWHVEWVDKSILYKAKISVISPKSKSLKGILSKNLNNKLFRCKSVQGFSFVDKLIVHLLLSNKKTNREVSNIHGYSEEENTSIKFSGDIDDVIQRSIPLSILRIPEQIKLISFQYKGGKYNLGSKQLWYDSTYSKLITALAIEHNEKVIGVQHGGPTYGTDIARLIYELEYRLDRFVTWGWSELNSYDSRFIPLPSPMLSKYIDKYRKQTDNLILVGTRAALFGISYTSSINSLESLKYRKNKIDFITSLTRKNQESLLYRPYFVEYGALDDRSFFNRKFPDIKLLGGALHNSMLKCKLLVLDHPGTTMCIAFVANIPTICFWVKSNYHFSKQSQPYFDLLEKAGILFSSGHDAADAINSMSEEDISVWWNSPKVQYARREWCTNYALTKKGWRREWFKFLYNLK